MMNWRLLLSRNDQIESVIATIKSPTVLVLNSTKIMERARQLIFERRFPIYYIGDLKSYMTTFLTGFNTFGTNKGEEFSKDFFPLRFRAGLV